MPRTAGPQYARAAAQADRGDYGFFQAGFPAFRSRTKELSSRVLSLANAIMAHHRPRTAPRIVDRDAVMDEFDDVVEMLDGMLEATVHGRGSPGQQSRSYSHPPRSSHCPPPPPPPPPPHPPPPTLVGPQPSSAPLGRRAGHGRGPPAGKPVRNAAGRARGHHGTCIAGKRATQRASTKRTRAYVAWGGRRGPPRADDPHLRLPDRPPWVAAAGTSRSSMPKTSSGHSCGSRTSRTTRTSRGGPFSKKSSLPRSP